MIWLFDSGKTYQDLLQVSVAEGMHTVYLKDRAQKTKKGRRSRKRDHLREFCREALTAISPEDPTETVCKLLGWINDPIHYCHNQITKE